VFRLHPLCRESLTLVFTMPTIEAMRDAILAIQDSQLAHTALQIRCEIGRPPEANILFEATPAGLLAQKAKLQDLLRTTVIQQSRDEVWLAKQRLWEADDTNYAIAKVVLLPSQIAKSVRELEKISTPHNLHWQVVLQATGIAWIRLRGAPGLLKGVLEQFRSDLEAGGGSLVLLRGPATIEPMDAWGNPGDAIGVMCALKQQLDPKATLNPGRFVGGI
jgi:glycolate oxidase FAD binding subunit